MLFISLAVITFGLAQTLPIVDEAIETPSTEAGGHPDGGRSGVVFDQRQTGKYNIHVSIKDVAIIEVGQNGLAEESYNDEEDYYYDDSALTVKPIKLSTEASTSTTVTSTTTTSSTPAGAPPAEITSPTTISSKPKSRLNNLMIVETPIGGATVKPLHHPGPPLHARSKDVPIMAAAAAAASGGITPPSLPDSIEYTPPQGHNSPIFKVKVQRSSNPVTKKPARCRNHQVRDGQGKCTDSI
ncbi:uncharacterized protein Dana_GF13173 [Drosophila ananassae]|uniref:Uncharacterized protein n=2 Tax=Drosophila ananassae TaxID=7217 RepID=B3MH91_DROAN|nr:uncharacterized protein LOC6496016 isoform X2 [Drosophila ananassae]EDV36868.2 uncharacterized protein Dana_GF13173 [Drosophila ananassae]